MAEPSKRISRRTDAASATGSNISSRRVPGAPGSGRNPAIRPSGRMPAIKKPQPEEEPLDVEPLIDEDDEQVASSRAPVIKTDANLISQDSLYADDDPLAHVRSRTTGAPVHKSVPPVQPPKVPSARLTPGAKPTASASGRQPAVSANAVPAKAPRPSGIMKAAPTASASGRPPAIQSNVAPAKGARPSGLMKAAPKAPESETEKMVAAKDPKGSGRLPAPAAKPSGRADSLKDETVSVMTPARDPKPSRRQPAPTQAASVTRRDAAPGKSSSVVKAAQKPAPEEVDGEQESAAQVEQECAEQNSNQTTRRLTQAPLRPTTVLRASTRQASETNDNARRSTKRSTRSATPQSGPAIPKKYFVLAGSALVLLAVVALMWGPFWKKMYLSKLDDVQASPGERKAAAKKLLQGYHGECVSYFSDRLKASESDAALRDAVIEPLEALAKERQNGAGPVKAIDDQLKATQDNTSKLLFINTLGNIYQELDRTPDVSKLPSGQAKTHSETVELITKTMLAQSEPNHVFEIRKAAIDKLAGLPIRQPGVCLKLLGYAKEPLAEGKAPQVEANGGNSELRDRARAGLLATVMPDAAGELIKLISSTDKALADVAQRAFDIVKDSAKSLELAAHLTSPNEDVRRTIVKALSTRKNDGVVRKAMCTAMRDKVTDIRLAAVKAIPTTGIDLPIQLAAVLADEKVDEVKIAIAQALASLRDEDSKAVLLEAFGQKLEGAVLSEFIKSLGIVFGGGRDMKALKIIMPLLDKEGVSEECIRTALVSLTLNNQGSVRATQRGQWDKARWKKWWANLTAREELLQTATKEYEAARKQADEDKRKYRQLADIVERAIDKLAQCGKMCEPDDPEDARYLEGLNKDWNQVWYTLKKSSVLNEGR